MFEFKLCKDQWYLFFDKDKAQSIDNNLAYGELCFIVRIELLQDEAIIKWNTKRLK